VQLAAQSLARSAAIEDRDVTMFGVYGGSMRGGNTDSAVVIGDAPIQAPPIVSQAWSAIVMSMRYWEPGPRSMGMSRKLVRGGLMLLNSSLCDLTAPARDRFRVVDVPATEIATLAGSEQAQTMVMLGAYAKVTSVVQVNSIIAGMEESLPDYRKKNAAANAEMIRVGYELDLAAVPFWADVDGEVRS
jgi:Pyruvate/2-oxoacid:ferredoxin oxidoreductase gamma subunit